MIVTIKKILFLSVFSILLSSAGLYDSNAQDIVTSSSEEPLSLGMLLESPESEALMLQVRSSLFNFKIEEARVLTDSLSLLADGSAAASYHKSWSRFLIAMFEQTDSLSNDFLEVSDHSLKSDALDDDRAWARLFKAEIKLQQAFVLARQGKNLRAAMAARKAFNYYKDNIDQYPLHWDSYKGLGIIQIMIGSIPSNYRKVLKVLGYSGTVEEGLRSLALAADKGQYFSDEARLYLAIADITVNQSKLGGDAIIQEFYSDIEPTPLVSLIRAYSLQSSRDAENVIEVCGRLLLLEDVPEYYLPSFVHFYMGDALYKLNKFEQAITHLKKFSTDFKGRSLKAPSLTKIGLSYDLLGRRDEALEYYEQVVGDSEYDIDVHARRTAQKYLSVAPSADDRQVLIATNLHDAGRSEESRAIFLELEKSESAAVNKSQIRYMVGRSFHHQGLLSDALFWYEKSLTADFVKSERWLPWSSFYAGEASEELGEMEQALLWYDKALSFKGDYDFKRSLEQKTKAAIGRVKSTDQI